MTIAVSFKVSKKGTRFRPKPKPESPSVALEDIDKVDAPPQLPKLHPATTRKRSVDDIEDDGDNAGVIDAEVSFILNIFPDGYTIKTPSEGNVGDQNAVQKDPKLLCPYDRAYESLFSAIECGRLPVDILDNIPLKYNNGAVVCEVRDYRRDSCEQGVNGISTVAYPSITKVSLKMSLNNVVKDIDEICDNAWTYGDLMEAESRILKALKPTLCLDPTPNLNRLCKEPTSVKLNLDIPSIRRKRLRQIDGAVTVSDNQLDGKLDKVPENSNLRLGESRLIRQEPDIVNLGTQTVGQSNMIDIGPKNSDDLSMIMSSSGHGERQNYGAVTVSDNQIQGKFHKVPEKSNLRLGGSRLIKQEPEVVYLGTQTIGQSNVIAVRPKNSDDLSLIVSSGHGKRVIQDGQSSSMANSNKRARSNRMSLDGNQQQMVVASQMDSINAPISNSKNMFVNQQSAGGGIQYPNGGMHDKDSGAMALMGQQGIRYNLKQEPVVTPVLAVGAMQRHHLGQVAAKWRSNSLPDTHVGYPSNGGNMSGQLACSSRVGKEIDRSVFDRFSKIRMVGARLQPNPKKNNIDPYKRTTIFPTQQLAHCLFKDHNNDTLKDETCKMPLSMSLVGGSMNVCKTRVLKFVQGDCESQGNGDSLVPKLRTRLLLSEKTSDGTVAMHYGELDDCDYLAEEELLPTFPNTHIADLFAAEFRSQIVREGYLVESDHLQPKPMNMVQSPGAQPDSGPGMLVNGEIRQILGSVSGQLINEVAKPPSERMHQSEPQSSLYHQQQLFQRSSDPLSHSNLMGPSSNIHQLGDYKVLPQILQQQQQAQNQRKKMMIMGMNTMRMGTGMGIGQLITAQAAAIMADRMVQQSKTNVTGGHSGNISSPSIMSYGIHPMHRNVIPSSKSMYMNHQQTLMSPQISSGAVHPSSSGGTMDSSGGQN